MKGKLYGVGAGPGDPELLTLKAVSVIRKCGVIASPITEKGDKTAFSIIGDYISGKELLECRFAMEKDMAKRTEARQIAARDIIEFLESGKDVAFVTLGDPTIYSTYMYIHEIVVESGFDAEIIPGITSFTAAAAALGIPLCENGEPLTLIPAGNNGCIYELLNYPGNKVIMKPGTSFKHMLLKLKELGYEDRTKIASRVTMEEQQLYANIEDYEKSPETGYFTIAIVKDRPLVTGIMQN